MESLDSSDWNGDTTFDSFEMGDDGLVPTLNGDPFSPAPEDPAGSTDSAPSAPPEAAIPPPVAHDWEKRYGDLRPAFDRRTAELREAREEIAYYRGLTSRRKDNQDEQAPAAEPDYLELLSDPRAASKHFQDLVAEQVRRELAPHEGALLDAEMTREVRDAVAKYPDFVAMQPFLHRIYENFPQEDITFERAYQMAKSLWPAETAAVGGQLSSKGEGRVPLSALRQRADSVALESGRSSALTTTTVNTKPAASMEEAFARAIADASRS